MRHVAASRVEFRVAGRAPKRLVFSVAGVAGDGCRAAAGEVPRRLVRHCATIDRLGRVTTRTSTRVTFIGLGHVDLPAAGAFVASAAAEGCR